MVVFLCIYFVWPVQAFAKVMLRIVHAVPGAGTATLRVISGGKTFDLGSVSFAHSSGFHAVPAGPFKWQLVAGGKTMASGTGTVTSGANTGVLMYRGSGMKQMGVMLHVYRDHAGVPGKTLIRMIHSAPEFGSPSLTFDGKTVAKSLAFMMATPYLTVAPGTHSLAAMGHGHSAAMLSVKGVHLSGGVAYNEIVVGTRGQRVRVLTLVDRGAPLTRPAPTPVKEQEPMVGKGPRWVTIKPGDSLWKIARHRCGSGATEAVVYREVVRIWDANVGRIGTGDPNLIFPGQRLHMPREA